MREFLTVLREFRRGLQRTFSGVGKAPLVAAFLISAGLAYVGQFFEIYLSYAEQLFEAKSTGWWSPTIVATAIALAVMFLLSAIIYISSKSLGRHDIEDVFHESQTSLVDPNLELWVKALGMFAALLPWIGLVSGIRTAIKNARGHVDAITSAQAYFSTTFDVSPTDLPKHVLFSAWLKDCNDWLQLLPPFLPFILVLAASIIIWLFRGDAVRLLRLFLTQSIAKISRRPVSTIGVAPLVVRTGRLDRSADLAYKVWLVQRPEFLRISGNLLVAMVAVLTFASISVPFLIENLVPTPAAPLRFWHDIHANLKPSAIALIMPTELGFWAFMVLLLGIMMFAFSVRLQVRRPTWIDRLVLIFTLALLPTTVWAIWGSAGIPGLAAMALVGLIISMGAWRWRKSKARLANWSWFSYLTLVCFSLAGFVMAAISGLMEFGWVDVARGIGPLAISLLLALVILGIVIGLCLVGRHNGIPALAVVLIVAAAVVAKKVESPAWIVMLSPVLFLAIAVSLFYRGRNLAGCVTIGVALVTGLSQFKPGPEGGRDVAAPIRPIGDVFKDWYERREPRWRALASQRNSNQRLPVFIIAAEGGGIYAAAAASAFLARLQERCPAFAQHVFAVSGVSGGAIGSTVFNRSINSKLAAPGCRSAAELTATQSDRRQSLQGRVAAVIKDDHLSPLTGLVPSDVFGTFSDRAFGFRDSLDRSMGREFSGYNPDLLFMDHWKAENSAPALVLNTTWVRVGNRVVFAPFELQSEAMRSRSPLATLETFSALEKRNVWSPPLSKFTLTRAAVTSARFPGILAAEEFKSNGAEVRRWSFVDGGYVDASGALTAHDIYRALLESPASKSVDLRLILLTGSQSDKELKGTTSAELRDAIAPIVALFSVRGLLSRIAVLETLSELEPSAVEKITNLVHPSQLPRSARSDDWRITTVELNHDDFKLELGWKLSNLTYDIVSLQLGQADLCNKAKAGALEKRSEEVDEAKREEVRPVEVAKTIRSNSCVMASIERLISATP